MTPSSSLSARCRRMFRACLSLVLGGLIVPATVRSYTVEGPRWPSNQPVVMYLQLGSSYIALADGSATWNQVASSALSIWNPCLGSGVRFTIATTATNNVRGDHRNSVFFSNTAFGSAFGDDVLAITYYETDGGSEFTEGDVVVNNGIRWDSYRGPLRSANCDLRRVLLHEFGHVLGLDHTDQSAVAVMTPVVTGIDNIQADDIAGVESIYGTIGGAPPVIGGSLSAVVTVGQSFQYQITASNSPISYYAAGLPTGLSVNTSTGSISGTASAAANSYHVTITASNAAGSTSATLVLTIPGPPVITSAASVSVQPGQAFAYQITASGDPTSFTASRFNGYPLPEGVTVNTATGLLSGTMSEGGDTLYIGATNSYGTATATLQLNPTLAPPVISGAINTDISRPNGHAYVGTYCAMIVQASRYPSNYTASGLPPGLAITSYGWILGSPTVPGTYVVTLSATNAAGTGTGEWTLVVGQTIALTSGTLTGQVGVPVTYQVTGSPVPTEFHWNFPNVTGLSIDPATGVVTGLPAMPATGIVRVWASNGPDGAMLEIPVNITPNYPSAFFMQENPSYGLDGSFNGVYYLQFLYGSPFGYYAYLADRHYIYHFDMGYEYVFDAADGLGGVYFYDFTTGGYFYTSPNFAFPYLYDFTLNSVVYYYPDPNDYRHYNTNGVRYFYVFGTGRIISK